MAYVCSLTGRHPASCLDVVMRCDTGLSHLDDVDPTCRAIEYACRLNFGHQSISQVFNYP